MNGFFQTAQQPTVNAMPVELEGLAPPPCCCPVRAARSTKRCGKRTSPKDRDPPSTGCSQSMSPKRRGDPTLPRAAPTGFLSLSPKGD